MSNRLEDEISQIWSSLDAGNISQAEGALNDLKNLDPDSELATQLDLLRIMYYLEIKHPKESKNIIIPYLMEIDSFSPMIRAEILALDARILINMSEFLKAENRIDKVHEILSTGSKDNQESTKHIITDVKNLEGLILASKGEYQAAITKFEEAGMEFGKQGRNRQRGIAMFNHGRILAMLGKNERAIAFFEEAAKIFKELDQVIHLSSVYEQLIELYQNLDDRDNVYTYKQLKQDLRDKLEFEQFKTKSLKERDRLYKDLSQANDTIKMMEEKIFNLKFQLDSNSALDQDTKSIPSQVDRQKAEQYDDLLNEVEKLKTNNDELELEIDQLQQEMESYKHELSQIVETKQALAQEMVKTEMLTADNEELAEIVDQLQKQNMELQNKLNVTTSEIEDNDQTTISDLRSTIEEQDKTITQLDNRIKEMNEQLEEVSSDKQLDISIDLQEANKQISELQAQLDSYQAASETIKTKEQKIKELNIQIKDLEETKEELMSSVQYQELSVSELKYDSETRNTVDGLKKRIKELEDRLKSKTAELDSLEHEKIALEVKLDNLPESKEKVQSRISNEAKKEKLNIPSPQRANPFIPGSDLTNPSLGKDRVLEELIASDRLIENIYERIKSLKSIKLRLLAMQAGVNTKRCRTAVKKLKDIGVVSYDESRTDPVIKYSA